MEERLSQEELLFIEDGIDFHKRLGGKTLKSGVAISIFGPIAFYVIGWFSVNDAALMALGLILLTFYIRYSIFERPKSQLEQDLHNGNKIIQSATVDRIKKSKEGRIYIMSNGIKITDGDFDGENVSKEKVGKGKKLIITYTPYRKMILNIKEK